MQSVVVRHLTRFKETLNDLTPNSFIESEAIAVVAAIVDRELKTWIKDSKKSEVKKDPKSHINCLTV